MKQTLNLYFNDIVKSIKKVEPYKIILFGSYATGMVRKDSDIDLLIVLNTNGIAKNYNQRLKKKILVRNSILEFSKKMPIDLLVYSKDEYKKFIELKSSFAREIMKNGKVLYEKVS
ncbi:MAG: nucleotidyltransferase domain-containing protein [Elusimicrobia bacterium]|nr:nucleotidyltransferase domain-containing protein [Candidatus Liberimonas magnetica]